MFLAGRRKVKAIKIAQPRPAPIPPPIPAPQPPRESCRRLGAPIHRASFPSLGVRRLTWKAQGAIL
jgi:hypothetical protein